MSWIGRLRASRETGFFDATVFSAAAPESSRSTRGRGDNPAAPAATPVARIADDIKRRQVSMAVRYVMAVRAR